MFMLLMEDIIHSEKSTKAVTEEVQLKGQSYSPLNECLKGNSTWSDPLLKPISSRCTINHIFIIETAVFGRRFTHLLDKNSRAEASTSTCFSSSLCSWAVSVCAAGLNILYYTLVATPGKTSKHHSSERDGRICGFPDTVRSERDT